MRGLSLRLGGSPQHAAPRRGARCDTAAYRMRLAAVSPPQPTATLRTLPHRPATRATPLLRAPRAPRRHPVAPLCCAVPPCCPAAALCRAVPPQRPAVPLRRSVALPQRPAVPLRRSVPSRRPARLSTLFRTARCSAAHPAARSRHSTTRFAIPALRCSTATPFRHSPHQR